MKDLEPIRSPRPGRRSPARVAFDRTELNQILSVYGFFVSSGEWRDYAIDSLEDAAVFSIYQRASEAPVYRVEKRPKNAKRQGVYAVIAATGLILKRGHTLRAVLRIFDRKRFRLID